jgi:hypothetical protein
MIKDSEKLLNSISIGIKTARAAKIPVIYVIAGFRKGYPEISPNNKAFSQF